jgi:hypothetical protein
MNFCSMTMPPNDDDTGCARSLVDWLKKTVEAKERVEAAIPKWIRLLAVAVSLIFVAFAFGLFGNRLYIVFGAFWLLFAAVQTRARTLFPEFPNFAFFIGWFILACMAVFIGYFFVKVELLSN